MLNQTFMGFVMAMSKMDITKTPNYIVATAIANHVAATFPRKVETAFSIKIEVNEEFVKDEDFGKVIDGYVATLNNIYAQIKSDFPSDADVVFSDMVKTMTLKYTF